MDSMVINDGIKLKVLKSQLEAWKREHYGAEVNAKVASAIKDDAMKNGAAEAMRRSIVAIDIIEAEVAKIEKELDGQSGGDDVVPVASK